MRGWEERGRGRGRAEKEESACGATKELCHIFVVAEKAEKAETAAGNAAKDTRQPCRRMKPKGQAGRQAGAQRAGGDPRSTEIRIFEHFYFLESNYR